MVWLKVSYGDDDLPKWSSREKSNVTATLEFQDTAPLSDSPQAFRVSPIFSVGPESTIKSISDCTIHFFNFPNAYKALGRIEQIASNELKDAVFFSCGLSSILLIDINDKLLVQFKEVVQQDESAYEKWTIENSQIVDIIYDLKNPLQPTPEGFDIIDYKLLRLSDRAIIDEFKISIRLLLLKLSRHMPEELVKMHKLVEEINSLIADLVYLDTLVGDPPDSLSEYTREDLQNKRTSNMIRSQNLDRIIQVNSALSYVSTQAFSGAIPIMERRSLIRRNSLLGIGTAILALNNVARFIEECFSKVAFKDVILKGMATASPLPGLENLKETYECREWKSVAMNVFDLYEEGENTYFKLPFFNGRLGFRETEYSIAAAIQSISSGASLEWSLMTITHEMLHGHVRDILKFIFYGHDTLKDDQQREQFYARFRDKMEGKDGQENLIDSIRNIIFAYCSYSLTLGSITVKKADSPEGYEIKVPDRDLLWNIFERENRNINEIFVHILDLHYFYASRISVYIPLIWCSWVEIPYINGDIRQYILRSVLTISSKMDGTTFQRFNGSTARLKELLEEHHNTKLNHPIIKDVLAILGDTTLLQKMYFPAFRASIIIVDMIDKIFTIEKIRGNIFNDVYVSWEDNDKIENAFEKSFSYNLPDGFNDEVIKSPVSYMLNKMINLLNSKTEIEDLEKESTKQFLALNSN